MARRRFTRACFFIVLSISGALAGLVLGASDVVAQGGGPSIPNSALGSDAFHSDLFTGSASFSVPIAVPPGLNDMAPNLALTYSSNGPNSWVGLGWALEVGSIVRSPATPSRLFLAMGGISGVELIPTAVDGNGIGEYRTKSESFVKVTYSGVAWTVRDKTGRGHYFGSTAASRAGSNTSTGAGTVRWALDRVTDAAQNAVIYTYVADQGQLYLDRIDYTSNSSIPPAHYVRFYRETRTDIEYIHYPGFKVKTAQRLKTIHAHASNGTASVYKLTYTQTMTTHRSTLTNFQRFGSDTTLDASGNITAGASLPAMTFTVSGGSAGFPTANAIQPPWSDPTGWSQAQYYSTIQFADINGDGRADICARDSGGIVCYLATGTGFDTSQIRGPVWSDASGWNQDFYYSTIQFADINGDGKADVCARDNAGIVCYLSTGSGFSSTEIRGPGWTNTGLWNLPQYYSTIRFPDINGDGRADVCARDNAGIVCYVSTGAGFSTTQIRGPVWSDAAGWNSPEYYSTIQFPDVNGDGKADVCARSSSGISCSLSNGAGFPTNITGPPWNNGNGWNAPNRYATIQFPDINGDGKADVCAKDGTKITCHLSDGSGFPTPVLGGPELPDTSGWSDPKYYSTIQFVDINGDGKADVCARGDSRVFCYLSTGNPAAAFLTPSIPGPTWSDANGWGQVQYYSTIRFPDITGDGKADVCGRGNAGILCYRATEDGIEALHTVINGIGGQATLTYAPSSQYVNTNLPFVVWTVAQSMVADGLGWSATSSYAYSGGLWAPVDREFRGFAQATMTDPIGTRTVVGFLQDDVKKGQVSWKRTETSAGQQLVLTTNTYTDQQPSTGVFWGRLDQTDTTESGGGISRATSVSFEYDSNGNLIRTYRWGDLAVTGDEREELTEWAIDATTWIHRPFHTVLIDPTLGTIREKWLYYDGMPLGQVGSRGLATREENRLVGAAGNAGNPAVTHTYDSVTGQRRTTTDSRGCTVTTNYGSDRYPLSVATCLPLPPAQPFTTAFSYDPRWGVKLSETDPNQQTTTFGYDQFGRLTKVTGPLDTSSQYGSVSYQYLDLGSPPLQRVKTLRTIRHGWPDFWWKEEYFDGLGRHDKTVSTAWPDTIETNIAFDVRGFVAAKSMPHNPGQTIQWTQFEYDALGRQSRVQHPDGTAATTDFTTPGLVVITDERLKTRRKFLDAYDAVKRVEETNGTETYHTDYAYDAAGLLRHVTNHLGHQTVLEYDLLGRKQTSLDPSMGTWTYTYDLAGNLLVQTDANGHTLTHTYDLQGRIQTKIPSTGGQTTFVYDETTIPFSKGRLTSIQGPESGALTTFSYDAMGRVVQTQRTLDGTTYTMSQTWNAMSQVTGQTFPDGETVTYNYNSAGQLSGIPGYIDGISYNARGQRFTHWFPNGVTTTWYYDDTTGRVGSRTVVHTPTSNVLQNLSYTYDNNGNVKTIVDNTPNGTANRTFEYDDLNRLTLASGTFGPLVNNLPSFVSGELYQYDAIGNVTSKGGVAYTYSSPSHPSAVTDRSDGKHYDYDSNGNMTFSAGRSLTWDADNRMTSADGTTYVYDHAGRRVKKITAGGQITRYPFPGYEIQPGGVVMKYIDVTAKMSTGERFFYHNDHLGGTNVVTDMNTQQTGLRRQLIEYDPWGVISRSEGNADLTRRFTGQKLDLESGLMYYGGRYYDPLLGRFESPDPFVPAPGNPQSLNRYAYVLNNPAGFVDPSGHFWKELGREVGRVLHFRLGVDRYVVPIVAGVAVTAVTSGCVPCGAAVAGSLYGGLNTAYNGGSLADIAKNAAITGAIAGASAAVGDYAGTFAAGLAASVTATGTATVATNAVGVVVGAAVAGAASGALHAAAYGGDVLRSTAYGALISAATAGVMYAGYTAYFSVDGVSIATGSDASAALNVSSDKAIILAQSHTSATDVGSQPQMTDPVFGPRNPSECMPSCTEVGEVLNRQSQKFGYALGHWLREAAPAIADKVVEYLILHFRTGPTRPLEKGSPPGCCYRPGEVEAATP